MTEPLVTIAVPNLNHGRYLGEALESIFNQGVPVEVVVMDGGSGDHSLSVIDQWKGRLLGWRFGPDGGQALAVNQGIAMGSAPYVCWLNSDDVFLPGGLRLLLGALSECHEPPVAYGRCWTLSENGRRLVPYVTAPFRSWLLKSYCFVAQPAALIRRTAWEALGGLDGGLRMAMDYDLWWRLYRRFGPFLYVRRFVAGSRMHRDTKTSRNRREHYDEAMRILMHHTGRVPIKWRLAYPLMVDLRSTMNRMRQR
jgi:glycosyltransferase involved in cell wall biosynthesis